MTKIGIVVQRYGNEINGGAEYHAKVLAEKLAKKYHVTILTTKAKNYFDWKDEYENDVDYVNKIKVYRFSSTTKNHKIFRKYRRIILNKRWYDKLLKKIGLFKFVRKNIKVFNSTEADGTNFINSQGPYCPKLIEFIKTNQKNYNCFIFFTYLYYPTVKGLSIVGDKSIFIPTAHNEPPLFSICFKHLFSKPKFIMYNSISEKKLVETTFDNACKASEIAGIGIDNFTFTDAINDTSYNFDFDYFVYIGRIESNKGCHDLINYFKKSNFKKELKLVLIGNYKEFKYKINSDKHIIFTGFVSENDKYSLLKNAKGLIIPSKYESLSLVTLESMLHEKLVIGNINCEVIKDHIVDSNSGYLFSNKKTFENSINEILSLSETEYNLKAKKGKEYVLKNYTWDVILEKFDKAISYVSN